MAKKEIEEDDDQLDDKRKKKAAATDDDDEDEDKKTINKETEEEEDNGKKEDKKKTKKKKKKINDDDEDDDEDTVEKTDGENPEEDTASAKDANSTIMPGSVIGSKPDIFTPQSSVAGASSASGGTAQMGQSPSDVHYGKSAEMNLSKQLTELKKSVNAKLDSIEKSVNDRISNILKSVENVEKFQKGSFYKAVGDNVSPEGTQKMGISEQLQKGKVRFGQ